MFPRIDRVYDNTGLAPSWGGPHYDFRCVST